MWIKRVEFENFINFHIGLGVTNLIIDFSTRENTMCLIVGPNGVGKTSLLSYLTPFATTGNLDIRDGNDLIIKGKPGHKKIVIMDGDTEYEVDHFYTPSKETHTVKSYFKQDGIELNENGNVTSFKELVKEFFEIDMDFLKLLRIGDNVSNLIKLKAAERKNFMAKFLDSVKIYLTYYKKFTKDVKDINLIISHTTDKLHKLNIDDETVFKENIRKLRYGLDEVRKEVDLKNAEYLVITQRLQELREKGPILLKEKGKLLKKWEKRLEEDSSQSPEELEKLLGKKRQKRERLEGELDGLLLMQKSSLEELDGLYSELTKLKKKLEMEKSKSKIDSLEDYIKTLHARREALEKVLPEEEYNLTKEEVDKFVVLIKNVQRMLNTSYEFGKEPIGNAMDLIENGERIDAYIASKLVAIEKKKKTTEKTYLDKLVDKYQNVKRPEGCDCPLLKLYDEVMVVKEIKASDPDTVKSPEYYQMVQVVYDNIQSCFQMLQDIEPILSRLPKTIQEFFQRKMICRNIRQCNMIYKDKDINNLMLVVTEHENYKQVLEELNHAFNELKREQETSEIAFLEKMIKTSMKQVEKKRSCLSELEDDIDLKTEAVETLSNEIDDKAVLLEALRNYTEEKLQYEDMEKRYNEIIALEGKKDQITTILRKHDEEMQVIQKELKRKEVSLSEYHELIKELDKAQYMYDDLVALKASSSNTKGVPLFFIELYLEDITEIANTMLDIVYHGDLYLDKFDIQADSFRIPFIKNGKTISDISLASQGEQSFLSMSISFALLAKNMTNYNIPLLDEVDGVFDVSNRERCISVIEKMNEIVHCEQEFIISHNDMYNQYPVDVLDFTNLKNSTFQVHVS